jgi:Activator of Hsp90 ATPase homolog 1-like protein
MDVPTAGPGDQGGTRRQGRRPGAHRDRGQRLPALRHRNPCCPDPPRRISFTWQCSDREAPAPDSVVTVSLEPYGEDQTLMTIHHALLPKPSIDAHEQGWSRVAAQVEARLGAR